MQVSQPFLMGMFVSLSVAVPVGPVALTCIRRTLAGGLRPGIASGLGAATAHVLLGALGLSGIGAAAELLGRNHAAIELAGGVIVIFLAARSLLRLDRVTDAEVGKLIGNLCSAYAETGLIALSNPFTIIGMAAAFSMFGLLDRHCAWQAVTGIFCGSTIWWLLLCSVIAGLRRRFSPAAMRWTRGSAAVSMGCLGVLAVIQAMQLFRSGFRTRDRARNKLSLRPERATSDISSGVQPP